MVDTVDTSTISPDDLPVQDAAQLDLPVQTLEVTPRVHRVAPSFRQAAGRSPRYAGGSRLALLATRREGNGLSAPATRRGYKHGQRWPGGGNSQPGV